MVSIRKLDCSEIQFDNLLRQVTANPYTETSKFLRESHFAADNFPLPIRKMLLEFRDGCSDDGAMILKSCPQEPNIEMIPTPLFEVQKPSFVSEICLAMVAARLGQIFTYSQLGANSLFQNIIPRSNSEHKQSNASSLEALHFHTETHFHPHSPDYLLLYCLRSSPEVKTYHSSVKNVFKSLDKHSIDMLFKPLYRTGMSYIFGNNSEKPGNGPVKAVFYGDRTSPFICYDQDLMVGETVEAQKVLDKVHKILQHQKQSLVLSAGDMLIIDNRRIVHGRSAFKAKYDGTDRWLQRTKVLRNIDQAVNDSHVKGSLITTKLI
ncbi:MAG: hypothetical protein COB22_04335 [Cycloclasticus sp.]|nr:MAG: hypothetical protein COB22_04335 [Cycloclasticus sp.]